MTTVHIKGSAARNWFAEQMVRDYGPDAAREKSSGPMLEAVERVIRDMPASQQSEGGKQS